MRAIPIVATTLTALALIRLAEPAPDGTWCAHYSGREGYQPRLPFLRTMPRYGIRNRRILSAQSIRLRLCELQPTGQRAEHIAAITRTALSCGTSWLLQAARSID